MNNKGFTLVEMLAVVVILGIVMGITTNGVINYINTSKVKSEKIFVDKLETYIESYVQLNGTLTPTNNNYTFDKVKYNGTETEIVEVTEYKFNLSKIVETKLVTTDKLINPKNKEKCLNGTDPTVYVFKDTDMVYYYYVDLSGTNTSCDISDENAVINTLPDDLFKIESTNVCTEHTDWKGC
jgi:prepilin-type N-terminal cleavage/methylation domain-containing protein